LPQSWSVLARVGEPARAREALAAVDARLVKRELGLIQLFDPPFDHSSVNPGYVKGYVPGVRENGGQYTHAAVWAVMAFAAAGDRERAWELFRLINPIHHGDTPAAIARYKVEPYVVAADVYTNPQHAGRGGWTWYTGSAAWMYRLALESLLGVRLEVDQLRVAPLLPAGWESFEVHYRWRRTQYQQGRVSACTDRPPAGRGWSYWRVVYSSKITSGLRLITSKPRL
jgi:cyclic beta-1,2-glucan synthetase